MPRYLLTLALLGCFLGSLFQAEVRADDLVAIAEKEKARRARIAKPVKVFRQGDANEAAIKGTGSVTTLPGVASPVDGAGSASAEASRTAWKARADRARKAITDAQTSLDQMERELNAFRSDTAPVPAADALDPMRLQKREAKTAEMNNLIQAQRAALAEARKALSAFEDEARRSGVPAGWLR